LLDGGCRSDTLATMNSSRLYFKSSFAGWFYFCPEGWCMRLR
jgi:hypothetical protein